MDDRLQQIFRIRPLQEEAFAYRNNMHLYRTMVKQTCVMELKKLVNVEMNILQTELKMPDARKVPPISDVQAEPLADLNALLKDVDITVMAMDLL